MKKNSKKFLALFLAFGMTIQPAGYIQAQEVLTEAVTELSEIKENAVQEESSAQSEAPVQTEVPAQTETPVQTEVPAHSEVPTQTEAPAQSEVPAQTEAPVQSEVQTETPMQSESATEACVTTPETEPELLEKTELKKTRAISKESPDTESVTEADTDGATYAVDNSTTLADGVYIPDQFTVTGGSSKTTFTCSKINVSAGKASATIEISSEKYTYVKANGQKYTTVTSGGKAVVTFPVQLNKENKIIAYTTAMGGKEITYMITITINEDLAGAITEVPDDLSASEKDNSAFTNKVDNSTTFKDAVYTPDGFSYAGGTNKTSFSCTKVTVNGGKAFATIVIKSAKYDYVKTNGCKYVTSQDTTAGTATVVIPIKLNEDNVIVAHTTAMGGKEISYTLKVTMNENQQEATSESETDTSSETNTDSETESETTKETNKNPGGTFKDGDYSVDVTSSAQMFRVIKAVITLKNGVYTANITLSGTGYDFLFMGTAAEAKADSSNKIGYTVDADGKYVFTIPVSALDQPIPVAAHSKKNDAWYDRTLTFQSGTMKLISSTQPQPGTETETEKTTEKTTEKPNKKPDKESKYEDDLSGATSAVNSSTSLADGVYTPDKFSWSGGSGRVSISCSKITVSGGQAYATLVFSSSSYSYIKANGRKYTGSAGGGTTSFTIPVQLNANNTVIGMTTAMSAAHEITYNIYIYLAAADKAATEGNKNSNSEEAPQIVGLNYQSETKLDNAKLLHIYNYDEGITLLEIDMTTDVKWKKEADATSQNEAEKISAEYTSGEEGETEIQTKEEIEAELYKADTLKYLIVPESVEIPVGMEKEMIIVRVPAKSVYVSSTDTLEQLDALNQTDFIKTTGFNAETCTVDALKDALLNEEIKYAGDFWNLEFKTLLLSGCDLALFSSEILPKEEDDLEEFAARYDAVTSGFATLGVPMIVDRSQDEESEEAASEWKKVYEILFECGETNEK